MMRPFTFVTVSFFESWFVHLTMALLACDFEQRVRSLTTCLHAARPRRYLPLISTYNG